MSQRDFRPPVNRSRPKPKSLSRFGTVLVLTMAAAAGWGINTRYLAQASLKDVTETAAIPSVVAVHPKPGSATTELVLPGTVQAFMDSPIYARTNGYLKTFKVDIGSKVKKGQLLAEIDTPEVNDQLRQAEADLKTALANQNIARSTAKRWLKLVATDSVTQQDSDEKQADAAARDAEVASAAANVSRLRELQNFSQVLAPFDGIISTRKTDIGTLINAGSGQGIELFHLVDRTTLRIYVQVPQSYAASVHVGQVAQLHFAQFPGRSFPATLVRTADAIDSTVRTLLVEFQVDNSKGEMLPGSYTEVHFTVPTNIAALRIPINTLIFRGEGPKVARISTEGKANIVPVILGRDFGTEIEIVGGVDASDTIIINPPDSLLDGQTIRLMENGAKAG